MTWFKSEYCYKVEKRGNLKRLHSIVDVYTYEGGGSQAIAQSISYHHSSWPRPWYWRTHNSDKDDWTIDTLKRVRWIQETRNERGRHFTLLLSWRNNNTANILNLLNHKHFTSLVIDCISFVTFLHTIYLFWVYSKKKGT